MSNHVKTMVTLLLATHVTLPHLRYGKLWEPSKQAPSSFSLEPAQIAGHVAGGHYHGRAADRTRRHVPREHVRGPRASERSWHLTVSSRRRTPEPSCLRASRTNCLDLPRNRAANDGLCTVITATSQADGYIQLQSVSGITTLRLRTCAHTSLFIQTESARMLC